MFSFKVIFEPGETEKSVEIEVISTGETNKNDTLELSLETDDNAKVGERKKMILSITSDDEFGRKLFETQVLTQSILGEHLTWTTAYRSQFVNAMNVNQGDLATATGPDYIMHLLSFAWKVLFALVPPPQLLGGYITFIVALTMIGFLIILVDGRHLLQNIIYALYMLSRLCIFLVFSDVCQMLGCLLSLNEIVVGATFVSIGTNLPDLLASKFATVEQKTADHAMLHINGGISVNVFLGPWHPVADRIDLLRITRRAISSARN